jgi:hypothetical protein
VDVAGGPDVLLQRVGVAVLSDLDHLAALVVAVVEGERGLEGGHPWY